MIDFQIANWIQGIRISAFDGVFAAISFSVYLFIIAVIAFYIRKKKTHKFLEIFMGFGIVFLLSETVKRIFMRPRPDLSDNFSFVSRHAAFAFFIAAFLPIKAKWKVVLYIWASLVAFGRLWSNLHWFSDVVFGAGLGIVTAFLIKSKRFQKYLEKLRNPSRT